MKVKQMITYVLLAFVAGSLIAVVVKQRGKSEPNRRQVAAPSEGSPQKATAGGRTQATASDELPQQTGVIAYYFHADFRCPTCKRIEALAHQIVTGDFATELREKKIIWKVMNYEDPANADLAEAYNVIAPTVVLVSYSKGTLTAWKNLMQVWQLVDDVPGFTDMLRREVRSALAEAGLEEPSSASRAGQAATRHELEESDSTSSETAEGEESANTSRESASSAGQPGHAAELNGEPPIPAGDRSQSRQ